MRPEGNAQKAILNIFLEYSALSESAITTHRALSDLSSREALDACACLPAQVLLKQANTIFVRSKNALLRMSRRYNLYGLKGHMRD